MTTVDAAEELPSPAPAAGARAAPRRPLGWRTGSSRAGGGEGVGAPGGGAAAGTTGAATKSAEGAGEPAIMAPGMESTRDSEKRS